MTPNSHSQADVGAAAGIKLSICIPTYNRAQYIEGAILSVMSQAPSGQVEIVVCDNHSTDGTAAIVARLARDFAGLRYIERDLNVGFDRNMLEVVAHSKGEYFWLLGSDDTLTPGAVATMMQAMADGAPDVIMADAIDCDLQLQQTGYLKFLRGEARDFHFDRQDDVMAYLDACTMTASLFGYISSIAVKRSSWDKVPVSRYAIGTAYPHIFRALDILFRVPGTLRYLAVPVANNRRNNCGYVAEFDELQRYLIDLRMFRIAADEYFSNDLRIRNRYKQFVRSCFGKLAQERIRTGIVVLDDLLKFFEADDAAIPPINHWQRYPLVQRAWQRFQESGIYGRYFSGEAILHIGYRHQGEAILKPIDERAIGVEPGYSGYDGVHLPVESASQDVVYVSDYFPSDKNLAGAIGEWFRVLRPGGHLVISNTLGERIEGDKQIAATSISAIVGAFEQALPAGDYRLIHCAQATDAAISEVDIVIAKVNRIAVAAPAPVQAPAAAPSAGELAFHALQLHNKGDIVQATALAHQALIGDPRNITALQLMGLIAYQAGNHMDAIIHFTDALTVNASLIEAYSNLGCAYAALGGNAEAMQCFATALSLRPDFTGAENNLKILQSAPQSEPVRTTFEAIVSSRPKVVKAREALAGIVAASEGYRRDPTYIANLDIERCFADRLDRSGDDTAILRRILASYQKASAELERGPAVFRPSNLWLPIYKHNLRGVIHALETANLAELDKIYRNFWRDSCSTGLVGVPVDMQSAFFSGPVAHEHRHLFLNDSVHRYNLWKKLLGDRYPVASLFSPPIGNPYGYYVDGQFIKSGADYQHYYATRIGDMLQDVPGKRVVAEIGGGFGGMAYYVIRDVKNAVYVDFDLPENLALTSYYLLKAFPEKKVLLYGEAEFNAATLGDYDIVLMPNFQIDRLQNDTCDLVFNSYSLAEMSPETIEHYVLQAAKLIKDRGWFFHVNHTKVSLVSARDFPIPKNFTLLSETFAQWNLGRNQNMDEYEFVYRKTGP